MATAISLVVLLTLILIALVVDVQRVPQRMRRPIAWAMFIMAMLAILTMYGQSIQSDLDAGVYLGAWSVPMWVRLRTRCRMCGEVTPLTSDGTCEVCIDQSCGNDR